MQFISFAIGDNFFFQAQMLLQLLLEQLLLLLLVLLLVLLLPRHVFYHVLSQGCKAPIYSAHHLQCHAAEAAAEAASAPAAAISSRDILAICLKKFGPM